MQKSGQSSGLSRPFWALWCLLGLQEYEETRMGQSYDVGEFPDRLQTVVCDVYVHPGITPQELLRSLESVSKMVKEVEECCRASPVFYVHRARDKARETTSAYPNME